MLTKKHLLVILFAHCLYAANLQAEQVIFKKNTVVCKAFNGQDADVYWKDIARLHLETFKIFPYLYDGSYEEEREEINYHTRSRNNTNILVFDNGEVVGVSRSILLSDAEPEFQEPFIAAGLDPKEYLYIAEVILEPEYRKEGLLRIFFEHHEQFARDQGCSYVILATSTRSPYHYLRPRNYRCLDPIWEHFDYSKMHDIEVKLWWKQVDTDKPVENSLAIWCKKINKDPENVALPLYL